MSTTNGTAGQHGHGVVLASVTPTCPTCGTPVTCEQYERILHIDDAQRRALANERAAIDRERADVARERATIANAAVTAERAKWEADAARAARAREKDIASKLAAKQARTEADADARVLNAKRAAEQQVRVVEDLQAQMKVLEQRRRRDEDAWKRTVAELQKKSEGRDRVHFGPEGEDGLVEALRGGCPGDRIEHLGKGGDVLQTVLDAGRVAGTIVYEMKKTQSWQLSYVRQAKSAMEKHGAKYGVLVSHTLPARCSGLCVIGGVIVTAPAMATQVVAILRDAIVALSRLRVSDVDKAAKTAALFEYLRGQDFATAIQRVQERVRELRDVLARERSSHEGSWRTREQQYAAILREAGGIDARVRDLLSWQTTVARRAKRLTRRASGSTA